MVGFTQKCCTDFQGPRGADDWPCHASCPVPQDLPRHHERRGKVNLLSEKDSVKTLSWYRFLRNSCRKTKSVCVFRHVIGFNSNAKQTRMITRRANKLLEIWLTFCGNYRCVSIIVSFYCALYFQVRTKLLVPRQLQRKTFCPDHF